jgi:hypothetical protein
VAHVDQELLAHPEHIILPQVFSGVRVVLSLVFVCNVSYIIVFTFSHFIFRSIHLRLLITPSVSSHI